MKHQARAQFAMAILAGVLATGIYAGIVAIANQVFEERWPLTAWAAVLIMALSTLGALILQAETRKRLDAMLVKWTGLEESTGLCAFEEKMEASKLHPEEQLHVIQFSLDFMGNGGSKWTREEKEMREMLKRLGNVGREARMLLLNPSSNVCKEASKKRFYSKITIPMRSLNSLKVLDRLRDEYPHLDFRLYDHTPYFRLTFVDGRSAIVGHYKNYQDESDYSPLMVWKADRSDWSFYHAFAKYFEAEWEKGVPISHEELAKLEERIKAYEP